MAAKSSASHSAKHLSANLFDDAKDLVRAFVNSSGLNAAATGAFGSGVTANTLKAAIFDLDRQGWPKLVLVDDVDLHGARAAYDSGRDTIYLSRSFLATAAPAAVTAALVEEIGHALDARVHKTDAPGDEGAIFAAYVLGQPPSASELGALKSDNDHSTVTIRGKTVSVELAAAVAGSVTLDGNLSDWTAADQLDKSLSVSGYDIYGKVSGGYYVFAMQAPVAIGADTTAWLNTDQSAATGYKIWGFAGGTEYNINFDATGTPRLYTGNSGQTLVSGAIVSFGFSADRKIVEFAVPASAIGSPKAINTLWDVNDNTYLPSDYSATQYAVIDSAGLPARTDFTKKVGILYSETSAKNYWDPMAYAQLIMSAQNQAAMAGVRYDVLTEADLTNLAKLVNYDALIFPNFANVQATQLPAIEKTLTTLVQQYHVGLIAAGEFMTYNATGAALAGDPYARMKSLLNVSLTNGGYPANVTVKAGDVTHPMMQDYASSEAIRTYTDAGWLTFAPVAPGGSRVLATQTVGGATYDSVLETTTGGRNIHFSTDAVIADNNLLWQAIDYVVNGSGVTAGLQLSRNTSIVATRTDMDQAQEIFDVNPESGAPGIYEKLLPVLAQWKAQYNFVGSYYVDIGANPPDQQTIWSDSGQYYKQLLAMGNELGSHSITHPHNTNALTPAQIQYEFQGSKQIIEQQMAQILGQPFVVNGAAVPGGSENLQTALAITQYYEYLSGGYSAVGVGYPGAIGFLTPAMEGADKVYIAPNVQFDFTLVEFQGMTPAQASAAWLAEWNSITRHAEVPVIVWPIHDYSLATWSTNPPAASPYSLQMFTDFISRAYASGAEFVTLADLADRIQAFDNSGVTVSVAGSTVTATVTSADAGQFALDLDNLGAQKIRSVTGWYAYDNDSVFTPRNGGSFTINLGTTIDDVTHITALPMRAELLSVSGNGSNLAFSLIGEGSVVVDLKNPSGFAVDVSGASVKSLAGEILTLDLGAIGQHDVSVTLSPLAANRAPTITSNGGGDTATVTVAENTTAVTTVTATDPDAGQTRSYSIVGGADQALFTIGTTGVLRFTAARNFEAPADSDRNNSYVVQVRVADNGSPSLSDTQTITVNVADVNDNAPVITTAASFSIAENTTTVGALTSTDADTVGTKPAAFSISGGADAARFAISGGNLVFAAAPNYESPTDADRNNSYVVQVSASDGANLTNKTITVNVTDVAEAATNRPPTITSNGGGDTASITVAENTTAVTTVTATDPDAGQTRAYSIVGGADRALFTISPAGVLSFTAARNFEAPADSDRNNSYVVQVRVADNGSPSLSDTQTITVTVTDVVEGTPNRVPVITSNGGGASAVLSLAENSAAVTTVTASDPDAGNTLTYSIGGGADAAKFAINATTGALTFAAAPDFETPADVGANNVYDVIVGVRDNAGLTDTQALAVTVTNVNGVALNGDANANVLTGTSEPDTISGNGGNDTLSGLAGNDVLWGGAGNDLLNGGAGADMLHGDDGDDVFIWDPNDAAIDAGAGRDVLRITGSGVTLDLSQAVPRNQIDGIGVIDLTGSGNNNATLSANDVFTMCWDNYLRFEGNTGDRVTVVDTSSWTRAADQVVGTNTFHTWTGSGAQLLIDTDITTNLV